MNLLALGRKGLKGQEWSESRPSLSQAWKSTANLHPNPQRGCSQATEQPRLVAPEQANETTGVVFRPLSAATGSSAGSAAGSVGTSRWCGVECQHRDLLLLGFSLPLILHLY